MAISTININGLGATGTASSSTFLRGDNTWASAGFSSGTVMLFAQTAAPTGWTKLTNYDNYALRVVSGTASTGGSVAFTTAFASGLVADSTTLTTSQIPSHSHGLKIWGDLGYGCCYISGASRARQGGFSTSSEGGGTSHNHTLPSFAVQYVDVIRASKD